MKKDYIIYLIVGICVLILIVAGFVTDDSKQEQYMVTFNAQNDTESTVVQVEDGRINKPTDPQKDGYSFDGWYQENVLFNFDTEIKNNVILTAKWVEEVLPADTFKVTFDTDGGNAIESQLVKKNKKVTKPADPIKSGYTFVEWQLNDKTYNFSSKVKKSIILKAVYHE